MELSIAGNANARYLDTLGERVRRLRSRRGMSRRILAQQSGVSERYLAELENGRGNISVLRLRAIANAMGLPVEDLVGEPRVDTPAYAYLVDYLRHAEPDELERLRATVSRRTPAEHKRHVALIGLRGAGKSTVGAALARRLAIPFVELVDRIEARAGMDVSEIFALGGQARYRQLERECLDELLDRGEPSVIATGGSLVSEPVSFERVLNGCVTLWLSAAPAEHMSRVVAQGDLRPMAGHRRAMDDLKRILEERESLYQRADYVIDTSGRSVDTTVDDVLALDDVGRLAAGATTV